MARRSPSVPCMGGCTALLAAAAMWAGLAAGQHATPMMGWGSGACALPWAWLARRAPPRIGTAAILIALFAASVARGVASRTTLEVASGRLVVDAAPIWLTARAVDHPWMEGGEPLAALEVLR